MKTGHSSDSTRYGTVPTAPRQMGYFERVRENGEALYAQRRPWRDLISRTAFGRPDSFADAFAHIRKNLGYFRVNYALIILGIVFLSLLWHPISLIVLIIMFVAWGFLYFFRDEPVVVFGRTLNEGIVIVVLSIVTFVAVMLTHATMTFLIGLLIAVVIVVVHAAFRLPEDLFLNEDEAAAGGLLSVVDGSIPVSTARDAHTYPWIAYPENCAGTEHFQYRPEIATPCGELNVILVYGEFEVVSQLNEGLTARQKQENLLLWQLNDLFKCALARLFLHKKMLSTFLEETSS